MAESQSMTSAEVVAKTLIAEHADFLREAVAAVVAQLMEAEIAGEISASRGERSPARSPTESGQTPHRQTGSPQRPGLASPGCPQLHSPRQAAASGGGRCRPKLAFMAAIGGDSSSCLEAGVEEREHPPPGVGGGICRVAEAHRKEDEFPDWMVSLGHEAVSGIVIDLDIVLDAERLEVAGQPLRLAASDHLVPAAVGTDNRAGPRRPVASFGASP